MKPQTVAAAAAAALVLFIFLSAEVQKTECLGTTTTAAAAAAELGCNSTRIGDCLTGGDAGEEYLMESETSRRLLAGGQRFISPGALNPKRPFCRGDVAGSCIGRPNKFYDKRPCGYSHLCRTSA
ncbi:hypothetical protein ACP275_11G115800 [Erythranthe tilingii]